MQFRGREGLWEKRTRRDSQSVSSWIATSRHLHRFALERITYQNSSIPVQRLAYRFWHKIVNNKAQHTRTNHRSKLFYTSSKAGLQILTQDSQQQSTTHQDESHIKILLYQFKSWLTDLDTTQSTTKHNTLGRITYQNSSAPAQKLADRSRHNTTNNKTQHSRTNHIKILLYQFKSWLTDLDTTQSTIKHNTLGRITYQNSSAPAQKLVDRSRHNTTNNKAQHPRANYISKFFYTSSKAGLQILTRHSQQQNTTF